MNGQPSKFLHGGFTANLTIDYVNKEFEYFLFDRDNQQVHHATGYFKTDQDINELIKEKIEDVKKNPQDYYTA